MRTILFIVLSTFFAQISLAQQDTLIIKLDDYGQITIMTDQLFSKKLKAQKFDDIYSKFYSDFEKIDKSEMKDTILDIRYVYGGFETLVRTIEIEKSKEKNTTFYFQDSIQLIEKNYNYTLFLEYSDFFLGHTLVQIAVSDITDFDKITKVSIDSLYEDAQAYLLNFKLSKHISYKIFYAPNNVDITIGSNKIHDYISLYPSFGMSVINSNFAPEIGFNIDIVLSHKNKPKYKFGINTSFLFIQDENDFFKVYTYNVANLYYHLFVRDNTSHSFSIGYMYRKTGPHFNGNTYTAAWQYNMKHIGVKLGGYYTKNEEGNYIVIPSIGLNFGL